MNPKAEYGEDSAQKGMSAVTSYYCCPKALEYLKMKVVKFAIVNEVIISVKSFALRNKT